MTTERDPAFEPELATPQRAHRLRRHAAQGTALRYLGGFRNHQTRVVLKALEQPGRPEFRVSTVGMLEPLSLLTECPLTRGVPAVTAGEPLEVRLFALRDLVLFQSEMLSASTYPAPYLHLAWPQELCVIQVRASARVQIDKPATFALELDGKVVPLSGHLIDLSTRGAAFLCDALGALVGDSGELVLVLEVDAGLPPVYVHPRAVVRSVREPLHHGGWLQYGLEFVDIDVHDALAIRAFLGMHQGGS
ncbi:MAG: PilZ domain-containing protein [Pseudomonadota bacterium]|nr:PilZ domain-containing protein [Pseudomonadota bacterium]